MSISSRSAAPPARALRRPVAAGTFAAVASILVAEIAGVIGKAAGAAPIKELAFVPLALLTLIGVIAATAAWTAVGARSNGARLLAILVPTVLIASFVPDLALGISGTAWSAVITMMIAHIAVSAVTIPVLLHWAPRHAE